MPIRPRTVSRILTLLVIFGAIGCSNSHEKTGKPPNSKRVELVTSITELSDVVVETLAKDEKSRFETSTVPTFDELHKAIRSKAKPRGGYERDDQIEIDVSLEKLADVYPETRRRVLRSWTQVRQALSDRKADLESLKVESFDHKKFDEYGVTTADNVRINVTAGSRKFAIVIDHCIQINGKWQIVGDLRLAPDATRSTARRKE